MNKEGIMSLMLGISVGVNGILLSQLLQNYAFVFFSVGVIIYWNIKERGRCI